MTLITGVHPYADRFPMLPQAELEELAESIRENGLRQPVVLTPDGLILDGRNRNAACELIGVTPETVVYDGDDLAEYVIDSNVTRRNMSTGARAMATALVLSDAGKREGGKWAYGAMSNSDNYPNSFARKIRDAGLILDWLPNLADAVIAGDLRLDLAYRQAQDERDKVDAEKRAKAIEANRKREATIREREENDRKLAALTDANSKFLAHIQNEEMTIAVAYAAHQEDTRKQRETEKWERKNGEQSAIALARAIFDLGFLEYPEAQDRKIREFREHSKAAPPLQAERVNPNNLRNLGNLLHEFAHKLEGTAK